MAEHGVEDNDTGRKRARDDSELDSGSPGSKRVDSEPNSEGVESSGVELDSPEAKRILEILDDLETVMEREEAIENLDSVIRSFEEELHPNTFDDDAGESQPELGYLLGASDDELGLPPTVPNVQEEQVIVDESVDLPIGVLPDSVELGNTAFGDELSSYHSFGNEFSCFDTVEELFGNSEPAAFPWQPESLHAL